MRPGRQLIRTDPPLPSFAVCAPTDAWKGLTPEERKARKYEVKKKRNAVDTNADGKIDYMEQFKALDTNNDGKISAEEELKRASLNSGKSFDVKFGDKAFEGLFDFLETFGTYINMDMHIHAPPRSHRPQLTSSAASSAASTGWNSPSSACAACPSAPSSVSSDLPVLQPDTGRVERDGILYLGKPAREVSLWRARRTTARRERGWSRAARERSGCCWLALCP